MPATKKFLDANGLAYFASLLNNYPDNEVLGVVINAIQEALDEKANSEELIDEKVLTENISSSTAGTYYLIFGDATTNASTKNIDTTNLQYIKTTSNVDTLRLGNNKMNAWRKGTIVLSNGASTGTTTIQPTSGGSARTLTLPSATGTLALTTDIDNAITSALAGITEFSISVVQTLPETGENGVFYFVPNSGSNNNAYDEYVWVNNAFEKIGSTEIDLSNYLQTTDIADWAKASTKPTYTASEVSALPDTTVIPIKLSDLTNDSGYITSYTETDPVFAASAAAGITSIDITNWNNKSTFSGSYNDLTDKPTIPSATTITQTLTSGTPIATINGTTIYAPSYTDADEVSY